MNFTRRQFLLTTSAMAGVLAVHPTLALAAKPPPLEPNIVNMTVTGLSPKDMVTVWDANTMELLANFEPDSGGVTNTIVYTHDKT